MLVISSKEFRDKQKSYLDQVDEGIQILIQRGKNKAYKIVPVTEDDTLMSREEFMAKIDLSLEQARRGEVRKINGKQELKDFLDSL